MHQNINYSMLKIMPMMSLNESAKKGGQGSEGSVVNISKAFFLIFFKWDFLILHT